MMGIDPIVDLNLRENRWCRAYLRSKKKIGMEQIVDLEKKKKKKNLSSLSESLMRFTIIDLK